jgi:hypothetical protein
MANSTKQCRQCKAYRPIECLVKHPIGTFCNDNGQKCVTAFTQAAWQRAQQKKAAKAKKGKAEADKAFRRETAARKVKAKTLTDYKDDAQKEVNRFIKFRDWSKPCVSCDKPHTMDHQRHASHYRAKGNYDSLRFDEANIWMSCATCNAHLSGNLIEYRKRLIGRIGQEELDRLEGPAPLSRWTVDQLKAIRSKYRLLANALEKGLQERH